MFGGGRSKRSAVAEGSSSRNPRRIRHIPSLWSSLHRLTRVRLWWRLALGVFWHRSRPYPATRNHVKALASASDSVAHDMHRGASYAYGRLHQMPKTRPASAADVLRGRRPTGAREQVCGPGVILTTGVKGAREISAGRSPLAKQVARAVRARQNHAGGVPANCGLVSPERSEPRSGRYAGCEQVGAGLDINRITRKRFNGLESHLFW